MIRFENTEVFGWNASVRGMRNAMNSWDKSDTTFEYAYGAMHSFRLGENDLKLMRGLTDSGDDHGKYARFLVVQVDITAPFYWWKEFKTYRKGRRFMDDGDEFLDPEDFEMHIETNSCSTMHKIHAKEFELDDFSHEHLLEAFKADLGRIVKSLNAARSMYLKTKDKDFWWQMIQLLPSSYNQKRTVQLNYQVLKNMYFARQNHKLDEWRYFCKWIEELPYFRQIVLEGKND